MFFFDRATDLHRRQVLHPCLGYVRNEHIPRAATAPQPRPATRKGRASPSGAAYPPERRRGHAEDGRAGRPDARGLGHRWRGRARSPELSRPHWVGAQTVLTDCTLATYWVHRAHTDCTSVLCVHRAAECVHGRLMVQVYKLAGCRCTDSGL